MTRLGASVWRWRWRDRALRLGEEHPSTRAAFGRYVAAIGGRLGPSAGPEALRALTRWHQPGWDNRGWRTRPDRSDLPTGGTLSHHND